MSDDNLWWRDGVIYQIYPRSFSDSNGDGIGDLPGIIDKLDYLSDLGITAVWLSPVNPSPDADFGYDVSDYKDIDPKYGTMADFNRLVEQAHRHEIRIILDLVLNHTSVEHPWFLESRSSRENSKRDWYIWRENPEGKNLPPNNWQAIFGGKGWEYDERTGQYYYHMFTRQQPDLNWRNPEVYAEMMDIFKFWADRGVDGFRLDVFNEYFKDAQFRDNPYKLGRRPFDCQIHLYDYDQPEIKQVVADIRSILDRYPERYAVGETFMDKPGTAAKYCGPGKLHAAFNFAMLHSRWNPSRYLHIVQQWEKVLSPDAWPNYVMNNHDNPRSATRFHAARDDAQLKVAAAMLLTLRGTPFLYYGEEIGMRDVHIPRSGVMDPVGSHYWPLPVGRDGCRTPMQWNAGDNAGFTNGKPWIRINPDYLVRNVEAQKADPHSLFNFYKSLMNLRKSHSALRRGMFIPINYDPQRVLAYLRKDSEQTILVALNFSRRPSRLAVSHELTEGGWELLLSNRERSGLLFEKGWLKLKGFEACLLVQK
jgi:alpha-glucosidase